MDLYPFHQKINTHKEESYANCIIPMNLREHYKNYEHKSSHKEIKQVVRKNAKRVRDVVLTSWLIERMHPFDSDKREDINTCKSNGGMCDILYVDFVYTQLIRHTYVLLSFLKVNKRKNKTFNFNKIYKYKYNYKSCEQREVMEYMGNYGIHINADALGCFQFFTYYMGGKKNNKKMKTDKCENKSNFNMCIYIPTKKEIDILFIIHKLYKYFYFNLYVPITTEEENKLIFFPFDLTNNLLIKDHFGIFIPYLYVHYNSKGEINKDKNLHLNSSNLVTDNIYNFTFNDHDNIFFIPLIAYNKYGARIGSGKGYYDRALKPGDNKKNNIKISISFDIFLYDIDFLENTDIILDYVINEKGIYYFQF
ncbi:hypothetical protein, conserved [Plasmodium gonderi]|uniref:5-formyltetrahydrofolate cyclo-ligase n=1 Tax=Plasmodium gonderi TaxID=77519 RepID=A0A1Y1JTT4_PLAGO|nr:hypothetical protein, conserved [Plasmodium gonderi]GAW83813.1 hypothetical protein, conserved [Plasmodium gonderi]